MQSSFITHYPRIKQLMQQHEGYLPVAVVQSILHEFDMTEDELLLAAAPLLRETSVTPISHFNVGSIAVGATGNWYVGANIEFAALPLIFDVHAEQSAVIMAHLHGETSITKITTTENPCGLCRQFLNELTDAAQLTILLPTNQLTNLAQLLPYGFGAKDLGVKIGLLQDKQRDLRAAENTEDEIVTAALRAANHSYSPYTHAYAGVALRTKNGKIYRGSYLENAAFNPSVPPMQAAFVHLIQSGATFADVTDALLLQIPNSMINHRATAEITLQSVCPTVSLQTIGLIAQA